MFSCSIAASPKISVEVIVIFELQLDLFVLLLTQEGRLQRAVYETSPQSFILETSIKILIGWFIRLSVQMFQQLL